MRSCPGRPRLARAVGVSTILLMLWVLVLAPVSASGSATGGPGARDAGTPVTIPGLAPRGNPNAPVAVSVILSQPAALAAPVPAGAAPQAARGAGAGAVVAQQGAFAGQATALDPKAVKVVSSQSQLLNRVTLNVPRRLLGRVQSLPGVVRVFPEQVYHAAQDVAPLQVDAVAAAEASPRLGKSFANAGQGVKIGIIDTGVDATTPFLTDQPDPAKGIPGFTTPMPPGFPKGVTSVSGTAVPTRKVIAARYFCDDTFDAVLGLGACGNPGDPRGVANGH